MNDKVKNGEFDDSQDNESSLDKDDANKGLWERLYDYVAGSTTDFEKNEEDEESEGKNES